MSAPCLNEGIAASAASKTGDALRTVILCRCVHARVIDAGACARIEQALAQGPFKVWGVDDLCERAAFRDPVLLELAAKHGTIVIACLPRAVYALLRGAGLAGTAPLPQAIGLKAEKEEAVLRTLGVPAPAKVEAAAVPEEPTAPEWQPWFPAIDYDRCSGCRQCLSFCPFGVYTLDADRRVTVANPRNCKNNCPACARICPEFAIVFPKVNDQPIDGSEVMPEHIDRRKAAALDPGTDIHALLARRRQRAGLGLFERNLKERESAGTPAGERSQAEQERAACMEKAGEGAPGTATA
jgi:NAD-dependent dihydropyrimidine dehydrogenase PreA subunit